MAEMDEFTPDDWGAVKIEPGRYIFEAEVKSCSFRDTDKEKAYMLIVFLVLEGEQKGFEFENRIYISKKAEWRARYFLKKFDYPEELLGSEAPILRKKVIEGLKGKILAEFEEDNYGMLRADVKKFDHINGTEIEEHVEKLRLTESQDQAPLPGRTDAEPSRVVDVNDDIRGEQPQPAQDLSMLDD